MNLKNYLDIQASEVKLGLFRNVPLIGFTEVQLEEVRALLSRVPWQLTKWVSRIIADPSLGAKHGRYDLDGTVHLNPSAFNNKQRLGRGAGWVYHPELTVVHEIGHSIYEHLADWQQEDWKVISSWIIGSKPGQEKPYQEKRPGWPHQTSNMTHKKGVGFTRHYAERNDGEDFADSFAFYILGKPSQMPALKRQFIRGLIDTIVTVYPQTMVEGPDKP